MGEKKKLREEVTRLNFTVEAYRQSAVRRGLEIERLNELVRSLQSRPVQGGPIKSNVDKWGVQTGLKEALQIREDAVHCFKCGQLLNNVSPGCGILDGQAMCMPCIRATGREPDAIAR